MNKQEIEKAIEELQRDKVAFEKSNHGGFDNKIKAFGLAISALEKQIPKKAKFNNEDSMWECQNCESQLDIVYDYCPMCGQRLENRNEN